MFLLNHAVIFQVRTFEDLVLARYDGSYPVSNLTRHGDFGVGTFNGLDGEMVISGGNVYRINGFGETMRPKSGTKTPFAFVTHFHTASSFDVTSATSSKQLEAEIDRRFPKGILAIRIRGKFENLLARSFAPQLKPYLSFLKILDRESMFPYGKVDGEFVGFRMPKSVGTLNVPGYHFHFLAEDKKHGGHVLGFGVRTGTVDLMPVDRIIEAKRNN